MHSLRKKKSSKRVESLPIKAAVQDGILVFQNKEANYKMWFDIRIQGDAAVYFGHDENLVKIGNGANLRRTRFAVKTQIDKKWYGELDTDWTTGTPELKDAFLEYTGVKNLSVRMGNFKEDFSIQRNGTSRYLQFMERPMVTYLAPSRHLGFNVHYDLPALWMSAGIFGPEVEGAEAMTLMQDGNKDYGLNEGLSYTGMIVYRPLHKMDNASLHLGAAVSYREPKLTNDGYNAVRYSSRNSTSVNRKKFLDTDGVKTDIPSKIAVNMGICYHMLACRFQVAF